MKHTLSSLLLFAILPFFLTDHQMPKPNVTTSKQNINPTSSPATQLEEQWLRSSHGDYVNIYKVQKNGRDIGKAMWIQRSGKRVNAKYFAFKEQGRYGQRTVYDRFKEWRTDKDVVLACSGAFSTELPGRSNRNAMTVGLTVDNGRIVNRNIDTSMDGLVIVYATGGIVVSDIENRNLSIGSRQVSVRDDKVELMDWAVKEQATIFQTQLLAYDNSLRISRLGRKEKRERRFLALAESPREGLFHIVFDLPQNNYLFDAARDIFYYLKDQKNMEVVALLNLDTGAYNILELNKDNEQRDFSTAGETDIKVATNLIVYHYSR